MVFWSEGSHWVQSRGKALVHSIVATTLLKSITPSKLTIFFMAKSKPIFGDKDYDDQVLKKF
jgi:hypothetical protein